MASPLPFAFGFVGRSFLPTNYREQGILGEFLRE